MKIRIKLNENSEIYAYICEITLLVHTVKFGGILLPICKIKYLVDPHGGIQIELRSNYSIRMISQS